MLHSRPTKCLRFVLFTVLAGAQWQGQARADDEAASAGNGNARDTRRGPSAVSYAFDDDLVAGDTVGSGGEILHVRPQKQRESLVRVRTSFVPELYQSVENL